VVRVPAGPLKKEAPPGVEQGRARGPGDGVPRPEAGLPPVGLVAAGDGGDGALAAADGAFDRAGGYGGRAGARARARAGGEACVITCMLNYGGP
jgi:hypothetical protein